MPIRYYTPVIKARRRGKTPLGKNAARIAALGQRMQSAFTLDWQKGITRIKANVSTSALEAAWRSKNYSAITAQVNVDDFGKYLKDAIARLGTTVNQTAALTRKELPASINRELRLDSKNAAIDRYLNTRTAAMVQGVTEPMQVDIQRQVKLAFKDGYSPREVATRIKQHIGLNVQQQQQYDNFVGTDAEKAKLYDRLLNYRAMMISRTEISFAQNAGQVAVWTSARDQGLIPDDATKVWVVDGSPCPKICDPMDGVEVALDESFDLPDGITVPSPPAHPLCRCRLSLNIGDNPQSGRENYKDGADQADDGKGDSLGNDGENNEGDYEPFDGE